MVCAKSEGEFYQTSHMSFTDLKTAVETMKRNLNVRKTASVHRKSSASQVPKEFLVLNNTKGADQTSKWICTSRNPDRGAFLD
jgi:hypothetical protein